MHGWLRRRNRGRRGSRDRRRIFFQREDGAVWIHDRFAVEAQVHRLYAACCGAPLVHVIQHRQIFALEIAVAEMDDDGRVGIAPGVVRGRAAGSIYHLQSGNRGAQIFRFGEVHFAHLFHGAAVRRFHLLREPGKHLHAQLTIFDGHVRADSGDHWKMEIRFQRTIEDHTVGVHQSKIAAFAQKRDRRAFGDFHFNAIRQRAAHGGLLNPRNGLELTAPFVQRNTQNAAIAVGRENFQHSPAWHVLIARNLHLFGMNQRHFRRHEQIMPERVACRCGCQRDAAPKRDAQVHLPGFLAEFAPLDFQRLLPPQILRLFVGQNFLGVSVRVHGSQFFQKITSFSSSTPKVTRTRSRTSSIRRSMSAQLAFATFTKKFAWRSLTIASPTRWPFRPSSSIMRPAEPPGGFLKMQPALFWLSGWLARRFSLQIFIAARISLNGFCGSSSLTRRTTSSGAEEVWRESKRMSSPRKVSSLPAAARYSSTSRTYEPICVPYAPASMRNAPPTLPGTPIRPSMPPRSRLAQNVTMPPRSAAASTYAALPSTRIPGCEVGRCRTT